jgi:hypothetical protein
MSTVKALRIRQCCIGFAAVSVLGVGGLLGSGALADANPPLPTFAVIDNPVSAGPLASAAESEKLREAGFDREGPRVAASAPGRTVLVSNQRVRGEMMVCLTRSSGPEAVGGCAPRHRIASLGAMPMVTWGAGGQAEVVMLVPDGYDTATVGERSAAVRGNVVSLNVPLSTQLVELTGPAGERTVDVGPLVSGLAEE